MAVLALANRGHHLGHIRVFAYVPRPVVLALATKGCICVTSSVFAAAPMSSLPALTSRVHLLWPHLAFPGSLASIASPDHQGGTACCPGWPLSRLPSSSGSHSHQWVQTPAQSILCLYHRPALPALATRGHLVGPHRAFAWLPGQHCCTWPPGGTAWVPAWPSAGLLGGHCQPWPPGALPRAQ